MINFYEYYNKPGLDNEHYDQLISNWISDTIYPIDLKSIEHIIIKDSFHAYKYATYIIKGRWIEAEHIIMKKPVYAYNYAKKIIKGRWLEAEQFIMKDPIPAHYYATDVIKDRWHEAEQFIMTNDSWWRTYCYEFNIC